MFRQVGTIAAAAAALGLSTMPASAQKSKDTLRISTIEHFSALDYYHDPSSETAQFVRQMYGYLVVFDERKGQFVPELAKSWKRVNPTTLEFELRDDIVWSSGNKFSADDVKHTIDYLINPKLRIRFKGRYNWVKEVKKLGPYKIQIIAKKPFATDLHTLAYRFYFYDSKVHKALDDKKTYGRVSPSTTGVYRAISVDRNKGFLVERFEPAIGKWPHRTAHIKRIQSIPIPDRQVQLASLLTGRVDGIRGVQADMAKQLRSNGQFTLHPVNIKQLVYLVMDAKGRSKNKIFTDKRVRQAFFKAIPRDQLIKNFIPAADIAELPKGICFKLNVACASSTNVIGYDPAGAKKLLAEAGYPNGFDFRLTTTSAYREVAQAVVGELRKVGIRATMESAPRGTTTKRRAKGELTVYMAAYPTFGQPTMGNIMNFFFAGTRNYNGDPIISNARKSGAGEFDLAKRTAIYQKAVDRVNQEAYVYAFSEIPLIWAHNKSVRINPNKLSIAEVKIGDWQWK